METTALAAIALPLVLSACAADPPLGLLKQATAPVDPVLTELELARAAKSARISFHYSDYYTLTRPNPSGCAGDARYLYDPVALATDTGLPKKLPLSAFDSDQTVYPAFIKNVSVDLTDANANVVQNGAFACSVGTGITAPPVSSCATFDYGALGGIPTTLGGTLMLIGGIEGPSYTDPAMASAAGTGHAVSCGPTLPTGAGANSCGSGIYTLGVNALPASVYHTSPDLVPGLVEEGEEPAESVSIWAKLSAVSGFSGPTYRAGASATYDAGTQKVLLFGGAAPLSGLASDSVGVSTYDTWVMNLKSQAWSNPSANIYILDAIRTLYDVSLDISAPETAPQTGSSALTPNPLQLAKASGARALFGYVPVPGMAQRIDAMTNDGVMTESAVDTTERLLIVGGYGNLGVLADSRRFNPTFGPEIRDSADRNSFLNTGSSSTNGVDPAAATDAYQWIDSYPTELMGNSYGARFTHATHTRERYSSLSSTFAPDLPPLAWGPTGGDAVYNTAFAPLVNASTTSDGVRGTGYVLAAGGFDASTVSNVPSITAPDSTTLTAARAGCTSDGTPTGTLTSECGGGLAFLGRMRSSAANAGENLEVFTSAFGAVTNFINSVGTPHAPALWTQVPEAADYDAAAGTGVPFVGGATMLPGFDLSNNEVALFGGFNCKRYVDDASAPCTFRTSAGRYWGLGDNPAGTLSSAAPMPTTTAWGFDASTGAPPQRAGMAAARGLDPAGNVLIVAWGGATHAKTTSGTNAIYYLFNNAGTPTWSLATLGGTDQVLPNPGSIPAELINATLVFSHVTRKFYLFGGVDSGGTTRDSTWELAVTRVDGTAGACRGAAGPCRFTWRELLKSGTPSTGFLTCYPSCPSARRSHRMAEVNYDNRNPGGIVSASGEQTCTAARPCSYGIFMEGGSPDGFSYLSDRWMFDPTANGGAGHWQRVDEFPPRALAAMTSLDYPIAGSGATAHRAILFGGETGLHSPVQAGAGRAFVPPTLGDTWMFDYDTHAWHRVQLLGKGYYTGNDTLDDIPHSPELERRQAYDFDSPSTFKDFGDATTPSYSIGTGVNQLSPPPLSGAIMVTRTLAPGRAAGDPLRVLKLPEVYLFGGRLKNGMFNPLDAVHKLCAGSTGEAFKTDALVSTLSYPDDDDFTCDAYDETYNPNSPSPRAGYVGRWLRKTPAGDAFHPLVPANDGAYLGAGAYDSLRDRIVMFGGLAPAAAGVAVTDARPASVTLNGGTTGRVYEYTPPQSDPAIGREGTWKWIDACTGSAAPTARYGHSLAYDPLNQGLVMTGGYDISGNPLTDTLTRGATDYLVPQVWTATYYEADISNAALNTRHPGVAIAGAPCYYWKPVTTFGNSFSVPSQRPPASTTASRAGLAHAASVYIPPTGYNTGFYTLLDGACEKAGPIATSDPSVNKLLAGGAYIDIDRSAMGAYENLLLNLTYLPLGTENTKPDGQPVTADESAVFRIHLVKTGQTADALRSVLQPRHLAYADTDTQFPQVAQSISVLAPPTGQITQEQILLPVSLDPGIDRIRIERLSGSGILLEASLFRLGQK